MKAVRWMVVAVVLATALAVWNSKRRAQSGLHETIRDLNRRLQELAAQNEQLSNDVLQAASPSGVAKEQLSELLRLRSEVGRLRQETGTLSRLREENRQLRADLAKVGVASPPVAGVPELASWPKETWAFAGYATPEAALQSALWAANKGDLQNLIASSTADFATNITNDLQTKAPGEVAAEIMNETAKLNSVHLLEKEVVSNDEIKLTVWMEGDHTETNKLSFLKVGNQWKLGKND